MSLPDDDDIGSLLEEEEDDNTVSYFPSADDEDPGTIDKNKRADEDHNAELRATQAQVQALQEQISKFSTPSIPTYAYQQEQRSQTAPNLFPASGTDQRAAMVKQLEQEYINNPGEALLKVYEAAQKAAEETVRRSIFPVAGQSTRFAIDQYKQNAKFLPDEAEEFDALIGNLSPETLANADPALLSKQLKILKAAAKGEALEKRQNTPQPRIPTYGVGGGSSSGGKATPVKRKLTADQRIMWDVGIENGMSPKDILASIDGKD